MVELDVGIGAAVRCLLIVEYDILRLKSTMGLPILLSGDRKLQLGRECLTTDFKHNFRQISARTREFHPS